MGSTQVEGGAAAGCRQTRAQGGAGVVADPDGEVSATEADLRRELLRLGDQAGAARAIVVERGSARRLVERREEAIGDLDGRGPLGQRAAARAGGHPAPAAGATLTARQPPGDEEACAAV